MNSLSPQRERFLYSQEKKLEDMNCIISNGSIGSIFLGNIESASSQEYLKRHNIGAVLSICMNKIPSQVAASLQYYQHIYLEDAENEQISRYFDQAFNFIEKAKQSTSVLVHCVAGISRSATLLASYLMRKNQISAKEALLQLERKRWQVYPNNGFLRQLTEFEKQVLKKETNLQTPVKMNNSDFLSNYSSPLNFTPQRKENNNQGLQSLEYQRIRKKYLDEPSSEIKSRGLEINLNFRKQTSDYLITTPELPRKSLFNDDLHKKQNSQGSIKDFNQKKKEILDTFNSPTKPSGIHLRQDAPTQMPYQALEQYQREFDTKRYDFDNRYSHTTNKPMTFLNGPRPTTSKLDQILNSNFKRYY